MEYEVCILAGTKLLTFVWPVGGAIHDIFICDMKPRHDGLLLWCSLGQIASSGIYIFNSYRGMQFNYILGCPETLNISFCFQYYRKSEGDVSVLCVL